MGKTIHIFIFLSVYSTQLWSQQIPVFSQYREYNSYINPASVNSDYFTYEYNLSLGVSHRRQWYNLPDGPRDIFLRGEYIIDSKGKFNLITGGYLIKDEIQPISSTGIYGRLGVIMAEDPYLGGISVGFTIGGVQYRVDANEIEFLQTESNIADFSKSKIVPAVGIGIAYFKQIQKGTLKGDNIYAGISMPQLLELDIEFKDAQNDYALDRVRHVFLTGGYYKYINESSYIEPSIWYKYAPNAPGNLTFSLRYHYANVFWIGTGYDTGGSLHIEAGINIGPARAGKSNFKIGYGFDTGVANKISNFGSSHEVNLSYNFDTRKPKI